jgi:bifunctional UDP-N-acetylglucosamine pyrophosphorylase/glucosamine-1-phosphate N-acetyltransferase
MAAGKGTRMKSRLPKVLHRLAGRALLQHVTDTAAGLNARSCVVITGHGATEVEAAIDRLAPGYGRFSMKCVRQEPQLGTGHAVQQAVPVLPDDGVVVVLSGDVPLIAGRHLRALIAACAGQRLALLTIDFADPTGYGRIVRGHARWAGDDIAARRCRPGAGHRRAEGRHRAERQIREVYSGIMAVPARLLKGWLARLDNRNAQGEYYLTDVVKFAVADGVPVVAHRIDDALQVAGDQQPAATGGTGARHQMRLARALMEQGVRLADPARLDVRGTLQCGQDVEIDVNCVFEGVVTWATACASAPNCVIANATIAAGAVIHPFTHIDGEKAGVRSARARWSARSRGCARARCWGARCTSATLSRSRTAPWPMAPRPTTWPTWATPRWASG